MAKQFIVNCNEEFHRRIKMKAVQEGVTIQKIVTEAVERYLESEEEQEEESPR